MLIHGSRCYHSYSWPGGGTVTGTDLPRHEYHYGGDPDLSEVAVKFNVTDVEVSTADVHNCDLQNQLASSLL